MIQQSHSLVFIQRDKILHSDKNLYMDVYSNFIRNCENLEQPRWPSIRLWMDQ